MHRNGSRVRLGHRQQHQLGPDDEEAGAGEKENFERAARGDEDRKPGDELGDEDSLHPAPAGFGRPEQAEARHAHVGGMEFHLTRHLLRKDSALRRFGAHFRHTEHREDVRVFDRVEQRGHRHERERHPDKQPVAARLHHAARPEDEESEVGRDEEGIQADVAAQDVAAFQQARGIIRRRGEHLKQSLTAARRQRKAQQARRAKTGQKAKDPKGSIVVHRESSLSFRGYGRATAEMRQHRKS